MKRAVLAAVTLMIFVAFGTPATSQQMEGINLEFNQLPGQITVPFPLDLDERAFRVRLKEGGTWSFSKQDVILGKPNPGENTVHFMALDSLELKDGARIVTNGNTLVIFVNTLNIGNGKIVAFTEPKAGGGINASAGGAGGRGGRGDDGGIVAIHVIQRINGFLDVDLSGQVGGDGGTGGKGPKGERGGDGAGGKSTVFDCRSGGENGKNGSKGGRGGDGGSAGDGGSGGTLFLYNIGKNPISTASYQFKGTAGIPGEPGSPGAGGDGGDGGRRGGGDGHCKGGEKDGDRGPVGDPGALGSSGAAGAEGQAVVKALNLEALLESVAKVPKNVEP